MMAWGVTLALAAASAVLLDVVGLLLPGIGVRVSPAAFASRALCLLGAFLVGTSALTYQRIGTELPDVWQNSRDHPTDAAAAVDVGRGVGRGLRVAGPRPGPGPEGFGNLAGAVGTLLLSSRAHAGRNTAAAGFGASLGGWVVPRWIPLQAGHQVPLGLVLIPSLGLGIGISAYFGLTLAMIVVDTLTGTAPFDDGSLPQWFYWVAVPGYLMRGLARLAAALAYRQLTRTVCPDCRR
jgi:hypothetical protein